MASIRAAPGTPRRASIRAQLLRLVLVVAVPLAALEAWNLYGGYQAARQKAHQQMFHLAQVTASETAKFLGQVKNIAAGLAARPAVRALDPAHCDPLLKDFLSLAPRFSNVVTQTLDGQVICSAVPLAGPTRTNPALFLDRLRGPDQLTVGRVIPGTITGRWAVPVGVPIVDARGGIAGAVVLPIDLLNYPLLPSVEGLSANAAVGIIDAEGTMLARSREAARFVGTKQRDREPVRRVLATKSGTEEEIGIDGVLRVRGYTPIAGTDWIAIASLPAVEVYAGISMRVRLSALIGIAVLALALLLAIRFGRQIYEPIAALAAAADQVAAGNLAARAPVAGAAETAELAVTFNRMLDQRVAVDAERMRLLNTLEASLNEIYVFDADTLKFTYVNRGALRNLGYSADAMGAMTPLQLKTEHNEASFRELIAPLVRGKREVVVFETLHQRADGTKYPVEVHLQLVASGGRREFLAVILDSTQREEAAVALRESEHRFRTALENVQLAAVALDPEGTITFCNDHLLALTGWKRDEMIGRNWFETFLPESVREPVRSMFRQAMASGYVPPHYESEIITVAGAPRQILWSNSVQRDARGKITGTVSIGDDITERKLAEGALRESEAKLRRLIDGLGPNLFVGLLTLDGVIVEANRPALAAVGLKPEDVIGKPVEETYWWTWSKPVQDQLRAAVVRAAAGESSRYDVQIRVAEGRNIWLDFSLQPMRDETGRIIYLVPSAMVIDDRKHAEEQIRKRVDELHRWYQATLGREERVQELKREVNELRARLGEAPRYQAPESDTEPGGDTRPS